MGHIDKTRFIYLAIENYKTLEKSAWVDTRKEAEEFLDQHPEHKIQYEKWQKYMEWLERQAKQQEAVNVYDVDFKLNP